MTRYCFIILLSFISIIANAQTNEPRVVIDNQVQFDEPYNLEPGQDDAYSIVAGTWQYSKPYVHADGTTFMGRLGKPIAKSKIKKKLDKAYKKLNIKKRWNSLTLNEDGTWEMKVMGVSTRGRYTYDPINETLTLKWNGIPLKSHTHRDGKKLYIAFDADRLLALLRIIGGISHSDALKAISTLSENYDNVMLGFEMKRAK